MLPPSPLLWPELLSLSAYQDRPPALAAKMLTSPLAVPLIARACWTVTVLPLPPLSKLCVESWE